MANEVMYQQRLASGRIFDKGAHFEARYVQDQKRLQELVNAWKTMGLQLVLTMGTFDIIHIGHFQYLEKAREQGDLLIVGVDSDEKVRRRKGPDRPVVPQEERIKMLTHVRHVDVVTLKNYGDPHWNLIKIIRPNVLVATDDTYSTKELRELKKYCGKVVVLEPQATTSTTAKIRRMQIGGAEKIVNTVIEKMQASLDELKAAERAKRKPSKK